MNEMYEAPKAEVIEMEMPVVLMGSADGTAGENPIPVEPED